jgi:hypothetical protein
MNGCISHILYSIFIRELTAFRKRSAKIEVYLKPANLFLIFFEILALYRLNCAPIAAFSQKIIFAAQNQ